MAQKSMPARKSDAHRDYPDAEPSYDGPDQGYDAIDADPDAGDQVDRDIFNLWSGDQADSDQGFPALDAFPSTLFDDLQTVKSAKTALGHGDS